MIMPALEALMELSRQMSGGDRECGGRIVHERNRLIDGLRSVVSEGDRHGTRITHNINRSERHGSRKQRLACGRLAIGVMRLAMDRLVRFRRPNLVDARTEIGLLF